MLGGTFVTVVSGTVTEEEVLLPVPLSVTVTCRVALFAPALPTAPSARSWPEADGVKSKVTTGVPCPATMVPPAMVQL